MAGAFAGAIDGAAGLLAVVDGDGVRQEPLSGDLDGAVDHEGGAAAAVEHDHLGGSEVRQHRGGGGLGGVAAREDQEHLRVAVTIEVPRAGECAAEPARGGLVRLGIEAADHVGPRLRRERGGGMRADQRLPGVFAPRQRRCVGRVLGETIASADDLPLHLETERDAGRIVVGREEGAVDEDTGLRSRRPGCGCSGPQLGHAQPLDRASGRPDDLAGDALRARLREIDDGHPVGLPGVIVLSVDDDPVRGELLGEATGGDHLDI